MFKRFGFVAVFLLLVLVANISFATTFVPIKHDKGKYAIVDTATVFSPVKGENVVVDAQYVTTYSSGDEDPYGCFRLVQRFYEAVYGIVVRGFNEGATPSTANGSFAPLSKGDQPQPGDIFYSPAVRNEIGAVTRPIHWAIIRSVSGNTATLFEQNYKYSGGGALGREVIILPEHRIFRWSGAQELSISSPDYPVDWDAFPEARALTPVVGIKDTAIFEVVTNGNVDKIILMDEYGQQGEVSAPKWEGKTAEGRIVWLINWHNARPTGKGNVRTFHIITYEKGEAQHKLSGIDIKILEKRVETITDIDADIKHPSRGATVVNGEPVIPGRDSAKIANAPQNTEYVMQESFQYGTVSDDDPEMYIQKAILPNVTYYYLVDKNGNDIKKLTNQEYAEMSQYIPDWITRKR